MMKQLIAILALGFLPLCALAQRTVYICTGPNSRKYHSVSTYYGLRRCSAEIRQITIEKARSMGRTGCKLCTHK